MSVIKRCIPLEPAAEEVCNQSSEFPRIYQLPPKLGRQRLEEAQSTAVYMYPADIHARQVNTGRWGKVPVYFVMPKQIKAVNHVIFYIHGAGWVFGSFHTHEKLVRELAARTGSLVVFPEYTRAPEAKYPVAIEQCFSVFFNLWTILGYVFAGDDNQKCFYPGSLTVAGDSVGGNMAVATALLRAMRGGPEIKNLLLYYPVTDACFCTPSYCQFGEGYYLYRDGMKWFWQQYAPSEEARSRITASPLRAEPGCLSCLPETMLINGQADVLRSEGEAFGEKLRCAGVKVTAIQVQGTIHDFVMLNALDQTDACRTAMDASVTWIIRKNKESQIAVK